jgi:arylsulfatase A-like enzyme
LLAITFGLCGGYLDLGFMLLKKWCWNSEGYLRNASDSPWTVPVGHVVLMVVPAIAVLALNRLRPVPLSLRAQSWLFATFALWWALLRLPLDGKCSLILAAGLGRVIGNTVAAHGLRPRQVRSIVATVSGVLVVLAVLSSGRAAIREYRTLAGLPASSSNGRNVVWIVWDTVSAYDVSTYGYHRNTTPNLTQWARRNGVTFKRALAPAPWTYPSHTCFFTGQWPFTLNSQWKFVLDAPDPTLAEFLTSRGYQTAAFMANTNCCTYETGLDRGFAHFTDYALTPRSILTRTVPGNWIYKNVVSLGDFYDKKWIGLQSRGAREINDVFLRWLARRRLDRPFFAFLNYFDAHEPYVPPPEHWGRFGIQPSTIWDYKFLVDYVGLDKNRIADRYLMMARDCYDDCIACLDEQLGSLLEALQAQGLLENTDVIITSDHGEAFGDHGIIGHSYSVNLDEVGVPLVILSSAAPAGQVVDSPVSLRDLPATVADLVGLSADSPFPGRSLAACWKLPPGEVPPGTSSPAFSEQASETAFQGQLARERPHPGLEMSVVALGHHYIRNGLGVEQIYDLRADPFERVNLAGSSSSHDDVAACRKMLLEVLTLDQGAVEVEKAYLAAYRRTLQDVVEASSAQTTAAGRRNRVFNRPVSDLGSHSLPVP